MSPDVLSLGRAISLWEGSLGVQGKAPKTKAGYIRAVTYLEEHLGRDCDPAKISVESVELVVGKWRRRDGKPLSPTTVHNRMVAMREFFAWGERRYGWENPMRLLVLPRKDEPVLRRLSGDEIAAMLAATSGRDHVAISIFAMLSLRLSEVLALQWRDVDLASGVLIVQHATAKRRKGRTVPIPPALRDILAEARHERGDGAAPHCYVLYRHKPGGPDLMPDAERNQYDRACKDKSVHKLVKRAATAAGLRDPQGVTSHMFRRHLLEKLLEEGLSPYIAAALVGHKSIETTAKYGGGASLKAVREALGDNPLCDIETPMRNRALAGEKVEPTGIEPVPPPRPADEPSGTGPSDASPVELVRPDEGSTT